jgi:hypothetical protein
MAEKYAVISGLSRSVFLRLIEKWRELQSGASDKKAPGYSQED